MSTQINKEEKKFQVVNTAPKNKTTSPNVTSSLNNSNCNNIKIQSKVSNTNNNNLTPEVALSNNNNSSNANTNNNSINVNNLNIKQSQSLNLSLNAQQAVNPKEKTNTNITNANSLNTNNNISNNNTHNTRQNSKNTKNKFCDKYKSNNNPEVNSHTNKINKQLYSDENDNKEKKDIELLQYFNKNLPNKNKISKFDMVKVRVLLGGEHWFVFSRYILSKMLKVLLIPDKDAQRIAFELKRKLVSNGLLDVVSSKFQELLFQVMKEFGYEKTFQDRYIMMNKFYSKRVPLIILISGSVSVGKSTIANKLSERMNISNVLQTKIVSFVMSGLKKEYKFDPFWKGASNFYNNSDEKEDNGKNGNKEINNTPTINFPQDNEYVNIINHDKTETSKIEYDECLRKSSKSCKNNNNKPNSNKNIDNRENKKRYSSFNNLNEALNQITNTKKESKMNLNDNNNNQIQISNPQEQSNNNYFNRNNTEELEEYPPHLQNYINQSALIRKGCSLDMLKAFKEGKPVILEGHHIIPKNFIRKDEETNTLSMYLPEYENETDHEKKLRSEINSLKIKGIIIPFLITLNEETHKKYIWKNNLINNEDKLDAVIAFNDVQNYLQRENNFFIEIDNSNKSIYEILDCLNVHILNYIENEYKKGNGNFN